MSLKLSQSISEIFNRLATNFKSLLPESNPFIRNNWINALLSAVAAFFKDNEEQISEVIKVSFNDTTYNEFLERRASIYGIFRAAATQAEGFLTISGTPTTNIPLNTLFVNTSGKQYESQASVNINANVLSVTSLTFSAGIVSATTVSDHELASNIQVTIAGANEADYNGTFSVIVTGTDTFTYSISGSPSSPATGTITASYNTASVNVKSIDFGDELNMAAGDSLTLSSPISSVNNIGYVQYNAIGGGADQESDEDPRARLIFRTQNPITGFNVAQITDALLSVSFVKRVFVHRITPAVGQITAYILKANNGIPSGIELTIAKQEIIDANIIPAHTLFNDVIVAAPTPISVNFTFTALTPNTASMKTAITNALDAYFVEQTEVGVDLTENEYKSVIFSTIDTSNGDRVQSFTLSAPSGDISIASDEIPVLGTITF